MNLKTPSQSKDVFLFITNKKESANPKNSLYTTPNITQQTSNHSFQNEIQNAMNALNYQMSQGHFQTQASSPHAIYQPHHLFPGDQSKSKQRSSEHSQKLSQQEIRINKNDLKFQVFSPYSPAGTPATHKHKQLSMVQLDKSSKLKNNNESKKTSSDIDQIKALYKKLNLNIPQDHNSKQNNMSQYLSLNNSKSNEQSLSYLPQNDSIQRGSNNSRIKQKDSSVDQQYDVQSPYKFETISNRKINDYLKMNRMKAIFNAQNVIQDQIQQTATHTYRHINTEANESYFNGKQVYKEDDQENDDIKFGITPKINSKMQIEQQGGGKQIQQSHQDKNEEIIESDLEPQTCQATINVNKATIDIKFSKNSTIQNLHKLIKQEISKKDPQFHIDNVIGFRSSKNNISLTYLLTLPEHSLAVFENQNINLEPIVKTELNKKDKQVCLSDFNFLKCVGIGGFSRVYLVQRKDNARVMALKLIEKNFILEHQKQGIVKNERDIMATADHPFLLKCQLCFESQHYIAFGTEYCSGGQLFFHLRKIRRMSQAQAKFFISEICLGISYLHERGVIYRDLKPENIFIDIDGHIRIGDYGLAKPKMDEQELAFSFCGSPEYMAPEMLLQVGHSYAIDYYCLGALLYELIMGLPPYYSQDTDLIYERIINQEINFNKKVPISDSLQDLLCKLLEQDPEKRLGTKGGITEILSHPWFAEFQIAKVYNQQLVPPVKPELLKFNFDEQEFNVGEEQFRARLDVILKENDEKFTPIFENFYFDAHPPPPPPQSTAPFLSKNHPQSYSMILETENQMVSKPFNNIQMMQHSNHQIMHNQNSSSRQSTRQKSENSQPRDSYNENLTTQQDQKNINNFKKQINSHSSTGTDNYLTFLKSEIQKHQQLQQQSKSLSNEFLNDENVFFYHNSKQKQSKQKEQKPKIQIKNEQSLKKFPSREYSLSQDIQQKSYLPTEPSSSRENKKSLIMFPNEDKNILKQKSDGLTQNSNEKNQEIKQILDLGSFLSKSKEIKQKSYQSNSPSRLNSPTNKNNTPNQEQLKFKFAKNLNTQTVKQPENNPYYARDQQLQEIFKKLNKIQQKSDQNNFKSPVQSDTKRNGLVTKNLSPSHQSFSQFLLKYPVEDKYLKSQTQSKLNH